MSPDIQRLALRHLGGSLAIALLMCLVGGSLLWASRQALDTSRRELVNMRAQAVTLHERYLNTSRDEALIRQTIQRFELLRQQGLIGPENRLDWANNLRQASQARRLENLEFSIAPQRKLGKTEAYGQYSFNASQMKFQLGLLHEGDLLRLLDDLAGQPDALIYPRHCLLRRNLVSAQGETAALHAECELDWITISPPASPTPAPQP